MSNDATRPENVMECACGDLRPLSQMYLRCTGGSEHKMNWTVQCIDCLVSEGGDLEDVASLDRLQPFAPPGNLGLHVDALGTYRASDWEVPTADFHIVSFGGVCPVQAFGTCCGRRPFYFRSRGDHIEISISKERVKTDDLDTWYQEADESSLWVYGTDLGSWPVAGWINDQDAIAFIEWGCRKFIYDHFSPPPPKSHVRRMRDFEAYRTYPKRLLLLAGRHIQRIRRSTR